VDSLRTCFPTPRQAPLRPQWRSCSDGHVGEHDGEVVDSLAAALVALHRHMEVAAQDHLLVRTTEYEVLDAPLLLDKDATAAG
jgi:hypothetical protein